MDEANFQALLLSPFTRKEEYIGIKADPKAPPAMRLNKVSETRFAAIKASSSIEAPNNLATSILRNNPANWLNINATMMIPVAFAI